MSDLATQVNPGKSGLRPRTVLMLLTNAYDPDPRVRQEALALIRMGFRVRLLAWDRDMKAPASECMEGVEVERIFLKSSHGRGNAQILFYGWLYLRLFWRGFKTGFDVVHCHDLDTLPLGFTLGKLKRKPIVYDSHESFTDMLEGSVSPTLRKALEKLENCWIRHIDLLITVGEKLRAYFEQRGARHSVVVGNWKRLDEFQRTEAENLAVRQRLGIPPAATVIVNITQLLSDRKIVEFLGAIDACPDDVYAIIGGKGNLEGRVKEWAARNPRIRFIGFVRGKEIPDYTCAADAVFYGFDPENPNARFSAPNKLFEALAAGRPLITGNFGEIADVVRRAECGIVLRKYDVAEIRTAIVKLADRGQRQTYAASAKRFGAASMNWENGERVLYREYSRLLGIGTAPLVLAGSNVEEPASVPIPNSAGTRLR